MELLSAKGFEPQFVLTRQQFARFQRSKCQMTLYHKATRELVEVHWALLSPGYSFSPAVRMVLGIRSKRFNRWSLNQDFFA